MLRPADRPPSPGMACPRLRQDSCWPPSPLAAVCLGGSALLVSVLACLSALICIQCHVQMLRGELSQLQGELVSKAHGPGDSCDPPEPHQRPGSFPAEALAPTARRKRDVGKTTREPPRQCRKQSVLHLIPARHSNSGGGSATEIWWEPFLQQGRALEVNGRDVVVKHSGLYFIYSQVLFHDPTFTMGQMMWRITEGKPDQILFRCVQSMPSKPEKAYNSCYSGGVFHLRHGDRLHLRIPRFNASFDASAHGTFLGLLRL
uniref:TNF superfamily member 13 n=1 Tax=Salvator merianae TaxID=96440 RepID=A0A8D0B6M6_SALMN